MITQEQQLAYKPKYLWERNLSELSTENKATARMELFARDFDSKLNGVRCAHPECTNLITRNDCHNQTIHHYIPVRKPGCNLLIYLKLAHLPCNSRLGKAKGAKGIPIERDENNEAKAEELRIDVDHQEIVSSPSTPAAILLNYDHETKFRRLVFQEMLDYCMDPTKYPVPRPQNLRKNAREPSGTGRAASYSYMERLIAERTGPLKIDWDNEGKAFVRFRDPDDRKLTVERLMAKYPKVGTNRISQEGGQ